MNYNEILKLCGHARLNACHNCRVYEYDDLSDIAKVKARAQVIQKEMIVYTKQVDSLKMLIKSNIHFCINTYPIRCLFRTKYYLLKVENDNEYYYQWVKENLLHFLYDGTHVTYMS